MKCFFTELLVGILSSFIKNSSVELQYFVLEFFVCWTLMFFVSFGWYTFKRGYNKVDELEEEDANSSCIFLYFPVFFLYFPVFFCIFTELLVGILSREAITRLMSWRKRTATAPARQKHIKNIKNIKYIQKIKKIYKNI